MTRTVEDAALLLSVIAGKDETSADPRSRVRSPKSITSRLFQVDQGLRIGVVEEGFSTPASMEVVNHAVREAIKFWPFRAIVETVSIHSTIGNADLDAIAVEGGLDAFYHGLAPYVQGLVQHPPDVAMSKAIRPTRDFSRQRRWA